MKHFKSVTFHKPLTLREITRTLKLIYSTEMSLFSNWSLKTLIQLSNLGPRLQKPSRKKTTIHEKPFPLLHYCGIGQLSSVALAAQTIGRVIRKFNWNDWQNSVTDGRCVGLHCHAEGPHLTIDRLFGWLRQHLGDCQLHSNEEVELAIREGCSCDGIFKLVSRWGKCSNVLGDYAKI